MGQLRATEGLVTSNPPFVKPSDLTQPFTVPVGPRADNGKYDVTFSVQCDDTTLSVNGAFDDATDQNGSFDTTTQPAKKSVEYAASTQGKLSNVTITIVSSVGNTQCTASTWRPHYSTQRPLACLCFGGDFLTGMIFNFPRIISNFDIKALGSPLLGANTSNSTSKQVFKFQVQMLKFKSSSLKPY